MKAHRTAETVSRRRTRPRKVESYADWMRRIDSEVEEAARKIAKPQPSPYPYLNPAQRQIVELLIEHMRSLPALKPGENTCRKPEYHEVCTLVIRLFDWKFPEFRKAGIKALPAHEVEALAYMIHNFAGPVQEAIEEDDED